VVRLRRPPALAARSREASSQRLRLEPSRFEPVATLTFSDNTPALVLPSDRPASPEEIFLAWVLCLPDGVDPSEATAAEVARLDTARSRSSRGERLRELFVAAIACSIPAGRPN
jgi:hypothetical protein